jgi:hypothetical protein
MYIPRRTVPPFHLMPTLAVQHEQQLSNAVYNRVGATRGDGDDLLVNDLEGGSEVRYMV